jgi:hypothetical protein
MHSHPPLPLHHSPPPPSPASPSLSSFLHGSWAGPDRYKAKNIAADHGNPPGLALFSQSWVARHTLQPIETETAANMDPVSGSHFFTLTRPSQRAPRTRQRTWGLRGVVDITGTPFSRVHLFSLQCSLLRRKRQRTWTRCQVRVSLPSHVRHTSTKDDPERLIEESRECVAMFSRCNASIMVRRRTRHDRSMFGRQRGD